LAGYLLESCFRFCRSYPNPEDSGMIRPSDHHRTTQYRGQTSALKMEAVCSSPERLVSTYKSTRRYSPEEQHRHLRHRKNLKSHKHPWRYGETNPRFQCFRQSGHNYQISIRYFKMCANIDALQMKLVKYYLEVVSPIYQHVSTQKETRR
jgi:hypothetical protein